MAALKRGEPWFIREDWTPYYRWLEERLFMPGRWAVIPDAPGAPSQLNDSLLPQWPFGTEKGAPLWHMDAPIERLLRLCDQYDRVCIGWVEEGTAPGCEAWFRRMDEVAAAFGNHWPPIHMMRGVLVAREYPFTSADATSGGQNGHRYDFKLDQDRVLDRWAGRRAYLDRLERGDFPVRVRSKLSRARDAARGRPTPPRVRSARLRCPDTLGLF